MSSDAPENGGDVVAISSVLDDVLGRLNIHHVHQAFHAAAYSIVRGSQRRSIKPVVNAVEESLQMCYEPPLVQAMESIQSSRIVSLNAASGKSVSPFLKKNTTIPWFHVPVVAKAPPEVVVNAVKAATAVKKRPSIDKTVKMESKVQDTKIADTTTQQTTKRPAPSELKSPPEKKLKVDKSPSPKLKPSPKSSTPSKKPLKLDNRSNLTRAILCTASAQVFQSCTPSIPPPNDNLDPTAMIRYVLDLESAKRLASKKKREDISFDGVADLASSLAGRVVHSIYSSTKRYDQRVAFRLDVTKSKLSKGAVTLGHSLPLLIPNPFREVERSFTDEEAMDTDEEIWTKGPIVVPEKEDGEWSERCLPRLLAILRMGAGHAVLHDVQWKDRAFRVAELLRSMAGMENYGPHLIVTTSRDIAAFSSVFGQIGYDLRVVRDEEDARRATLRVLVYHGSRERRRVLRKHFGTLSPPPNSPFCFLGGHADSPYHVIVTTYAAFADDYSHFCQIPFQAVVLDDGMSWMGCAHADPTSKFGKVWESAIWSTADHGAGFAGVSNGCTTSWDFSKDDGGMETDKVSKTSKSATKRQDSTSSTIGEKTNRSKLLIGLTARHRILLASNMHARCHGMVYKAPVASLLSFLAPHLVDTIQEEWDKSKMSQCDRSMTYLRKLIARSVVVYTGKSNITGPSQDLFSLAVKSLNGEIDSSSHAANFNISSMGSSPDSKKHTSLHRKDAFAWFRPGSAILYELGDSVLDSILAAVKKYNSIGFLCEEIVPASTLTASGANGAVCGPAAYRTAVRCGRQFSNEQSLKQHIAAFHAPAGTWLCNTCGIDCVTSQAKTHHERSCVPDGR
jgi:hypothetical protein